MDPLQVERDPSAIQYRNAQVFLAGKPLGLWDSYGLSKYRLGTGSISEDARGRWYLNVTIKLQKQPRLAPAAIGKAVALDLNLRRAATSDAVLLEFEPHHRLLEEKIARAQRAKKPELVRALCAKAANRRKDQHHKHSTALVRKYDAILRRPCEFPCPGKDTDGPVRARCRLGDVANHAPVQMR
ncbi:hypothetical protein [Caballeronia mineralivorans]|uniref:hypothetical protein n=1 Tax=Caballeronia mineralivorans TaxID=2010198 RepID=UPI00069E25EB|nr:hypothetical protein [Caballeronia mineralivorans]